MTQSGQLLWLSTPGDYANRLQVRFSFDPGTGLTDVDFHAITDRNWAAMVSPSPDAVAVLEAPAGATLAQLHAALKTLAVKGQYRFVEVLMRQS